MTDYDENVIKMIDAMETICDKIKEKDTVVTRYENILFTAFLSCKNTEFKTTIQTVKDQWGIGAPNINAYHIKAITIAQYSNLPKLEKHTPPEDSFVTDIVKQVTAYLNVSDQKN